MNPKRALLVVAAAFILLNVVLIYLALKPRDEVLQTISLPDDSKLRLAAVTYGTNHVVGGLLARVTAKMPVKVQPWLQELLGSRGQLKYSRTTVTPKLIAWFEITPPATHPRGVTSSPQTAYSHLRLMLANADGFVSGESAEVYWPLLPQLAKSAEFGIFPRRSPTLEMLVFQDLPKGAAKKLGSFRITNPVSHNYPRWSAESLPAVRRTGDVEVVLERFSTGHSPSTTFKTLPEGRTTVEFSTERKDWRNHSVVNAQLRSLSDTNRVWIISNANLSDATGNMAPAADRGTTEVNGVQWFTLEPSLWPDEAAWKLQLEIKRTRGFATNELIILKAVPLPAVHQTNYLYLATKQGGVTFTLTEFSRQPPLTEKDSWSTDELSHLKLTRSGLTPGWHLDLISVVQDDGYVCRIPAQSSSGNSLQYSIKDISLEARSVDITFAVHQDLTVEFLVIPEVSTLPVHP